MNISIIAAMAENYVIGKDNKLPWRLPADLQNFRKLTLGHHVVMGRKTYESIGKPLRKRTNIIISHNPTYHAEGCWVVGSIEEALTTACRRGENEVFFIGGAEIYRQVLPITEKMYLTFIHHSFEGDTSFPAFDPQEWQTAEWKHNHRDEENEHSYTFFTLERVKKY